MDYIVNLGALQPDSLTDSGFPIQLWNIKTSAQISRGMLIASNGGFFLPVQSIDDRDKPLLIAANPAQGYSSGKFNRNKIILRDDLSLDDFELSLRKQNIILAAAAGDLIIEDDDKPAPLLYMGDWLTLYFQFPSNVRQITMTNPRDDLTKDEIKAVGKLVTDKNLLTNATGERVIQLVRADLITKNNYVIF